MHQASCANGGKVGLGPLVTCNANCVSESTGVDVATGWISGGTFSNSGVGAEVVKGVNVDVSGERLARL